MKAFLVLADAASSHPDGTFSLLRGGINQLHVQSGKPALFRGALVARIFATISERGHHDIRIRCLTEDGASVLPDMSANIEVPDRGGAVVMVMEMQMVFPKTGRYEFSLSIDKHEMDTWLLEVKPQLDSTRGA